MSLDKHFWLPVCLSGALWFGGCGPEPRVTLRGGARSGTVSLPASAAVGSTPARRAAWARLDTSTQQQRLDTFRDMVSALIRPGTPASSNQAALVDRDTTLQVVRDVPQHADAAALSREVTGVRDGDGSSAVRATLAPAGGDAPHVFMPSTTAVSAAVVERAPAAASWAARAETAGLADDPNDAGDSDGDGLSDGFEQTLSDLFAPAYHVSGEEKSGTGGAMFGDYVPQTVLDVLPAAPPLGRYRVRPLGELQVGQQRLRVLQIDYLTLWNRDDGLAGGAACQYSIPGAILFGLPEGSQFDGATAHALDNERSAVLVAAPVEQASDPRAYAAYSYFLAAHERQPIDTSTFIQPYAPLAAGTHLELWLARGKHGTYEFNPEGYPLLPSWVLTLAYGTLDGLHRVRVLGDDDYLVQLYLADMLFFQCTAEHFIERGQTPATTRINIGDTARPLGGSAYIQSGTLRDLLDRRLWQLPE